MSVGWRSKFTEYALFFLLFSLLNPSHSFHCSLPFLGASTGFYMRWRAIHSNVTFHVTFIASTLILSVTSSIVLVSVSSISFGGTWIITSRLCSCQFLCAFWLPGAPLSFLPSSAVRRLLARLHLFLRVCLLTLKASLPSCMGKITKSSVFYGFAACGLGVATLRNRTSTFFLYQGKKFFANAFFT